MALKAWFRSSAALLALAVPGAPALAQSIQDTLSSAYVQSTQLDQQRAQQRATDEQVPQALSNWRPTLTVNGNVTRSHTEYAPASINNAIGVGPWGTSKGVGVQVVQNIYRG